MHASASDTEHACMRVAAVLYLMAASTLSLVCCWLPGSEAAAGGKRVCDPAGNRAAALAFGAAASGGGRKRLTAAGFFAHSQIAHTAGFSAATVFAISDCTHVPRFT